MTITLCADHPDESRKAVLTAMDSARRGARDHAKHVAKSA
jgi:hypothetical protein